MKSLQSTFLALPVVRQRQDLFLTLRHAYVAANRYLLQEGIKFVKNCEVRPGLLAREYPFTAWPPHGLYAGSSILKPKLNMYPLRVTNRSPVNSASICLRRNLRTRATAALWRSYWNGRAFVTPPF